MKLVSTYHRQRQSYKQREQTNKYTTYLKAFKRVKTCETLLILVHFNKVKKRTLTIENPIQFTIEGLYYVS